MMMTDTTPEERPARRSSGPLLLMLLAGLAGGGLGGWLLWHRPAADPSAEAAHADELPVGVVEVRTEAQKNANIEVAPATLSQLPVSLDVTGRVAAEDARIAHIRPLARGLVERVWVSLGERVTKGQPLATYDNIQLGELVGDYLGARAVLRQAEADLT